VSSRSVHNPAQLERELSYYRRECNDLGARLLRLQEEQSTSFREARRSRTVAKLIREAYRLGDIDGSPQDVGGPMLEIVVDNAMCDRAGLMREEPRGSGRFVITHAIGLTEARMREAAAILNPPSFGYSTGDAETDRPLAPMVEVLQLPFVLWAYDQAAGQALVIGNRSESNVSRPFEAGDQELIEGALSVYLDVLYRKEAEAQLRLAKQAAEQAAAAKVAFVASLRQALDAPLSSVLGIAEQMTAIDAMPLDERERAQLVAEMRGSADAIRAVIDDAALMSRDDGTPPILDVSWTGVDDAIRAAVRAVYPVSVREEVEIKLSLPRRRAAICVDRGKLHEVLSRLMVSAVRASLSGGNIRVSAERHSNGALVIEIQAMSSGLLPESIASSLGLSWDLPGAAPPPANDDPERWLPQARRVIEAHGGTLIIDMLPATGSLAKLTLPASITRDER